MSVRVYPKLGVLRYSGAVVHEGPNVCEHLVRRGPNNSPTEGGLLLGCVMAHKEQQCRMLNVARMHL